jgi:hypothetical protein
MVVLDAFVYCIRGTLLGGQPSRLLLVTTTKQGASDAEKEQIRNCHTPTIKLNTYMTALQNQPKKEPAAVAIAL